MIPSITPLFIYDANGNIIGFVASNGQTFPTALNAGSPRYGRAPTALDNTSRGYSSTSVWQAGGAIYQTVGTPDAVSAAWAPNPSFAGPPTDVFTAAKTKFAGGLVPMKAGFTGACIDISVTIGGTATPFTINILAPGVLDIPTLQAAIGRADAGTRVLVTKLYDQSGAGNHASSVSTYTASITGTSMTVTAVLTGAVGVGQTLSGTGARQLR